MGASNPKTCETPSSGRSANVKALRRVQAQEVGRMEESSGAGNWSVVGRVVRQRGRKDQSVLGVMGRGKRSGL